MKLLQANNDKTKFALVDDDVFETIQQMKLKFGIMKNGYFQSTSHMIKLPCMTKKKQLFLHSFVFILKTGNEPMSSIDHADINPLNNQFSNLRLATMQQQCHNRGKMKNNKSGFIGVSHNHNVAKRNNKTYENDYWVAQIQRPDGHREIKRFHFTSEGKYLAAKYYDTKSIEYFGEFHGELNFPDDR